MKHIFSINKYYYAIRSQTCNRHSRNTWCFHFSFELNVQERTKNLIKAIARIKLSEKLVPTYVFVALDGFVALKGLTNHSICLEHKRRTR